MMLDGIQQLYKQESVKLHAKLHHMKHVFYRVMQQVMVASTHKDFLNLEENLSNLRILSPSISFSGPARDTHESAIRLQLAAANRLMTANFREGTCLARFMPSEELAVYGLIRACDEGGICQLETLFCGGQFWALGSNSKYEMKITAALLQPPRAREFKLFHKEQTRKINMRYRPNMQVGTHVFVARQLSPSPLVHSPLRSQPVSEASISNH